MINVSGDMRGVCRGNAVCAGRVSGRRKKERRGEREGVKRSEGEKKGRKNKNEPSGHSL